jgi:pilus assembly protein CpaB
LYPEGYGPNLADNVKPGFRAVTVPIAGSGAVNGFAAPGSIVDVIFRAAARRGQRNLNIPEVTLTLLEGVEVLALGTTSTPGIRAPGSPSNVTLAVTPEQASALKVVEGRGELSLMLRSPGEVGAARPAQVTLEELLGLQPEPPPFTSEIYRGASRQTVTFQREQVAMESFGGIDRSNPVPKAPVPDQPETEQPDEN